MNKQQTEQAFIISRQLRSIVDHQSSQIGDIANEKLSMQAIVDTALFPTSPLSQARRLRINQNLQTRRLFTFALKHISEMQSRSQVAASSIASNNTLALRKGEGFELKLVKDPDNKSQAFLLVKLEEQNLMAKKQSEKSVAKGLFLHCEWQDEFCFLHLKESSNRRFQTIISFDETIYHALSHHDSRLYLSTPP